MKYIKLLQNTALLLAIVLLNSVSFVGHSSAMSMPAHDTGNMEHSSVDSSACATLCRTAVVEKQDRVVRDNDEQDKKDTVHFYEINQPLRDDHKSITQRLYAAEIKPPPKIPIYILYGVFRA